MKKNNPYTGRKTANPILYWLGDIIFGLFCVAAVVFIMVVTFSNPSIPYTEEEWKNITGHGFHEDAQHPENWHVLSIEGRDALVLKEDGQMYYMPVFDVDYDNGIVNIVIDNGEVHTYFLP